MRWFIGGLAAALGLTGCIGEPGADASDTGGVARVAHGARKEASDMAAVTSPATGRLLDDERPVRVATATFALG